MNGPGPYRLLCLFSVLSASSAVSASASAGDWAAWRGPEQTGATREKAVVTSWSAGGDARTTQGQNLLWHVPIGGRTTPIVHDDRVFLITPVGQGVGLRERVICLDAGTGKTLWENAFNVFHTDIVENRLGWTAVAVDPQTGNVYAHATGGELFCFERDGRLVWKHSLTEEFGRISGYGGRLYTPVVDEDRVILGFICSSWGDQAKTAHRFTAFDKHTGAVVWSAAPGEPPTDTTYATPTAAVIGGKRLLIAPCVDGWVYGLLARTGETAWKYRLSARPLNTTPVVDGNYVYVTHSEENYDTTVMGRVACIDGAGTGDISQSGEVWRQDGVEAGYASPAIANGRLYVVDNSANFFCFDAKTGQPLWDFKLGRIGRGSPVVTADGVIYVGEHNGTFYILKDAGDRCEVLDREEFPPVDGAITEIQGSPAVANGRVYFQTRYGTYCLGRAGANVEQTPARPAVAEADAPGQGGVLMVPTEVTLAQGESTSFELWAFTSNGRPAGTLSVGDAQWSLAGVGGRLDGNRFTPAADAAFSAGQVKARLADGREAAARLRICPKPPFSEDFERYPLDATPPGWLGVVGKTKVIERDGNQVLAHLSERPHPGFMRVRTYMTPPIAGGYTIEADVLGGVKKTVATEYRPDVGLVNSRYELLLMGDDPTNLRLRLVTWAPVPRLQHDVQFGWEPNVWYRMKFQVKLEGGKGLLRGKVWPRDQIEPAVWTLEAEDPYPNTEGSPALYGYANGTTARSKGPEILWDNVKVMPND